MPTVDQYLSLVPSANASQPKFMAMITAMIQPYVDLMNVLQKMSQDFDVDQANGAQLDVVGQWVGVSRQLKTPISGVYFSLDTDGVGFDEGVWFDPGDPDEGIVELDDDTYRTLISMKIAANQWDGKVSSAQLILQKIITNSPNTRVFIDDGLDMTMSINTTGTPLTPLLKSLFEEGYFSIRPAGVKISAVNTGVGPYFGFDNQNFSIAGFDSGEWSP